MSQRKRVQRTEPLGVNAVVVREHEERSHRSSSFRQPIVGKETDHDRFDRDRGGGIRTHDPQTPSLVR